MTAVQKINFWLGKVPNWLLYVFGALPPLWFLWLGMSGGLGAEPIRALEGRLGELALQFFVATLAVTPLRNWTGINLVRARRAIGVLTFSYVFLHLLVWLVLDVQILDQIWADILKRPYITIGMLAFVLMVPLALTSNNLSIRKLGPKGWRRLHRLTYAAGVLGAVHFLVLAKGFQIAPLVYLALILGLLATRIQFPRARVAA